MESLGTSIGEPPDNPYVAPEASSLNLPEASFRQAQYRILLATMFCYVTFYTGRQTFGFAIPGIERDLGISKETLGWMSALLLWSYALGQSINGNLGDKYGGRRLVTIGAFLSCGLNWVVSFGQNITSLALPWTANGYAQSMAWAPASKVLSNWWPKSERGKVFGAYTFSAGLSSVVTFLTATLILHFHLDWRWIFRLPVLSLLVGGIVYFVLVRDRPEELGYPPLPEEEPADEQAEPALSAALTTETSWERYRAVLSNVRFMLACIAIGFQSMARYGLLIWVPVHFLGKDWESSDEKWISIALPIGMALGALTSGWISDRLFHSNRSRVIGLFMALAAGCSLAMYLLPRGDSLGMPLLFLTGFFAYGPQSAFWALCPDMLGRERSGTGTGVMNTFAYAFAGFGEPLIGHLIESRQDTSVVFGVVSVACIASTLISLLIKR